MNQSQRIVFGAVSLLASVVLLGNAFGNVSRGRNDGSQLPWAALGVLFLAAAVYLAIRFVQSRRNAKNAPPLPK